MTDLHTAAKQALEALEFNCITSEDGEDLTPAKIKKAITALRAALEQPAQQEPVGYWQGEFSKDGGATLYEVPQESMFGRKYRNIPLYDHPQAREPLTRRQIQDLVDDGVFLGNIFEITQSIEAAHGITGEKK